MLQTIIDSINSMIVERQDDGTTQTDLFCDKPLLQQIVDSFIEKNRGFDIPDAVFYIAVVHAYYCIDVLEYYNTELYTLVEVIRLSKLINANYNERFVRQAVLFIVTSNDAFYVDVRRKLLGFL
jgi:hypothetical protein